MNESKKIYIMYRYEYQQQSNYLHCHILLFYQKDIIGYILDTLFFNRNTWFGNVCKLRSLQYEIKEYTTFVMLSKNQTEKKNSFTLNGVYYLNIVGNIEKCV